MYTLRYHSIQWRMCPAARFTIILRLRRVCVSTPSLGSAMSRHRVTSCDHERKRQSQAVGTVHGMMVHRNLPTYCRCQELFRSELLRLKGERKTGDVSIYTSINTRSFSSRGTSQWWTNSAVSLVKQDPRLFLVVTTSSHRNIETTAKYVHLSQVENINTYL